MNNDFNNFNDFLNYCMGYSNNNSNNNDDDCGGDIPGGFQTINPQFFLVIGEIIGNVMAGNMPFNVQNVIGNWLQLIGQAIETYNAQQQYMQGGPGRYYDIRNLNVNNPFCSGSSNTTEQKADGPAINPQDEDNQGEEAENQSTSSTSSNSRKKSSYNNEVEELKNKIDSLNREIEVLKREIENIKNQ